MNLEIEKINTHMIEATMFHSDMVDAFGFLNLWGFQKLHEHQFLEESKGKMEFNVKFIDEFNEIPSTGIITRFEVLPEEWEGSNRNQINNANMPKYVKYLWDKYVEWEEKTKILYEEACKEFQKMGDFSKFNLMNVCLKDVQQELVKVYRVQQELRNCGYDPTYILDMQDKLYEEN